MKVDPRFLTGEGVEVFTGNELLIKGALETEGGVHLLGGYPGSPVAGYFDTLLVLQDLLHAKGIRAVINNNEALSAAMLNGSQTLPVRSMIVMKSVGVHVAADALALGNLAGANVNGGAIVVYGDDPWSDSTQVPCDSRYISKHLFIPTIEPSTPQEVKDFVDYSFRISRTAELFAGYVLTTNLADGGGTVVCKPNCYPTTNVLNPMELETAGINLNTRVLLPPKTWWQEETLTSRHARAMAQARQLGMNRIDYKPSTPREFGFVSSGMAHAYLTQTLMEMGMLGEFPILKFGMTYPIDADLVAELAGCCKQIVVVEERREFMEEQIVLAMQRIKQAGGAAVPVWGKQLPGGLKGIPSTRGLHPSILTGLLAPLLKGQADASSKTAVAAIEKELRTIDESGKANVGQLPPRLPTFCPGCPHRDSSSLCIAIKKDFMDAEYMSKTHGCEPVDMLFHGDTGCYTMLMFPPTESLMHDYSGMGLGGGSGVGTDRFITNKEAVFMGDSTFFHSGQLAISQAVKTGQDITFIILDNRTTAMTGHQPTPGVNYDIMGEETNVQDIEAIVNASAGSSATMIVRTNPQNRDEYRKILEEAFLADGVKIIIADKECGITRTRRKRRLQRQEIKQFGFLAAQKHMNVNQAVCRFCLACTEATVCPGLKHVDTEYGPKMDTDISWCVMDGACQRIGACDAFEYVKVHRCNPAKTKIPELALDEIPEPQRGKIEDSWRCCLVGVGGMGIGLATSIVVRAGHKEGYDIVFLDKKGLAIRNGGVVSQIVFNVSKKPLTAIIPFGKADLLLGMDILEAARTLDPQGRVRIASADRTAAVINTDKIPTTKMLMGQDDFSPEQLEKIIRDNTRAGDFMARNISRICERYLGSKLYANIMMIGFAFQKGLIPVSMHSIAWAIKDAIRTDTKKNMLAFNIGRKLVVQPDLFQGPVVPTTWQDTLERKCRWTLRRYNYTGQKLADELRQLAAETVGAVKDLAETDKQAIVVRTYDCMRWGGIEYAGQYCTAVRQTYARDAAKFDFAATRAVIYNLASAMLIKDAVYTAELLSSPEKYAHDCEKYNVNPANGDRVEYRHIWTIRIGGLIPISFRATLPHWLIRKIRRWRWIRKLSAGNYRREQQYLAEYRKLVDSFAPKSDAEYRAQLVALSGPMCMSCLNPKCRDAGCPLCNHIPAWIELASQGQWQQAAAKIHETNNFPEFTSLICPAPCQNSCKRGAGEGYPVQIRQVEKEIIDRALAAGWVAPIITAKKTGKKVAVIGSGPAGLACAQQLARAGHDVTVIEKEKLPGGLLRYGIPSFRLPKKLIDRRIEQMTAEGVKFTFGADVAADSAELRKQFDAVCIAIGAAKPRDLAVAGRELSGIYQAVDFLRQEQDGTAAINASGKSVVVIGGGLTGEDCVELALKQGAKQVQQLEIMPKSPSPSIDGDIDESRLTRKFSVATKAFVGDGAVKKVQARHVAWNASPQGMKMTELAESQFEINADMVLLAMGFQNVVAADFAAGLGLTTDAAGKVAVTGNATDAAGVFVAGDVTAGPSYVATAMASGRTAAGKINAFLAGKKGSSG